MASSYFTAELGSCRRALRACKACVLLPSALQSRSLPALAVGDEQVMKKEKAERLFVVDAFEVL
jgi:hypothetical protein